AVLHAVASAVDYAGRDSLYLLARGIVGDSQDQKPGTSRGVPRLRIKLKQNRGWQLSQPRSSFFLILILISLRSSRHSTNSCPICNLQFAIFIFQFSISTMNRPSPKSKIKQRRRSPGPARSRHSPPDTRHSKIHWERLLLIHQRIKSGSCPSASAL